MIEALLLGVRQAIIAPDSPFDYGKEMCDVRADGQPPPRCGNWFVAVHQLGTRSTHVNCLNEYYSYAVTLTGRVSAPLDRIGDAMLAQLLAKKTGFNRRLNRLRAFLHMNWSIIALANDALVQIAEDAEIVYGFCEAARFADAEVPVLVGGDWFDAAPDAKNVGLKAQLTFADARRMQAIGTYT